MSGCFLQCWWWEETSPASWPHNFLTQGVRQAAEMEPSQQPKSCPPPHVEIETHHPGRWPLVRLSKAGLLTTSVRGVRPQAQLTSLLSCVKKLLISWLSCRLPLLPNKAALLERGSRASQRRGSPGAPQHLLHTHSRAVGLLRRQQRGDLVSVILPLPSKAVLALSIWRERFWHKSTLQKRARRTAMSKAPFKPSALLLVWVAAPHKSQSPASVTSVTTSTDLRMRKLSHSWKCCLFQVNEGQHCPVVAAFRTEGQLLYPLWSHGGRQLCCSLLHNYQPRKNNKHSICKIPLAVDICRYNKPFAKARQTHFLIYKSVPRTLEVQATSLHSQRWQELAQIDQKFWDPLCKYANHVQNRKVRLSRRETAVPLFVPSLFTR